MNKKAYRLPVLLLALLLALSACGQRPLPRTEGSIHVFYLNKTRTTILSMDYEPESPTPQETITELIGQLTRVPSGADAVAPVTGFALRSFVLEEGILTLNFSAGYQEMDTITETLVRAAIVDTLTQVEGVDSVTFYVEGNALTSPDGKPYAGMTADSFALSSGTNIRNYERTQLHLYFCDESGESLVYVTRAIIYNANISMDRLVVEQIIKGPNSTDFYPTVNPDTRIISVTSRDRVCYVNLGTEFLQTENRAKPEIAVYSLVNSLTELPGVDRVQILIDGSAEGVMAGQLDLSVQFERNMSLVEGYREEKAAPAQDGTDGLPQEEDAEP